MKPSCYLLSSFLSSSATGFKVYLRFAWPSGLPKCDIRTTDFAPLSKAYLMESRAATIRWLLVITPSLRGTLKSTLKIYIFLDIRKRSWQTNVKYFYIVIRCITHLIRTLLPLKSRASMLSLFKAILKGKVCLKRWIIKYRLRQKLNYKITTKNWQVQPWNVK